MTDEHLAKLEAATPAASHAHAPALHEAKAA
jgi:hypothetical protein